MSPPELAHTGIVIIAGLEESLLPPKMQMTGLNED
jgi:hypothetical protein